MIVNIAPYILFFVLTLPSKLGECRIMKDAEPSTNYDFFYQISMANEIELLSAESDFLAAAKNESLDCNTRISALTYLLEYQKQKASVELNSKIDYAYYRYKKGIGVLKMLYEKILDLDHHFSSLRTFSNIQELSNPNSYPEFASAKQNFKKNTQKKSTVVMPEFLENNPFISVGYTLISSVFGGGNKEERSMEIENISCLLDFTISMHSDIKIIYYETDFLKMSNKELMNKCNLLFEDYTSVINYGKSLDYCRNNDDWDNLFYSLDKQYESLKHKVETGMDKKSNTQLRNLEFSVDRLIKFIDLYEDFIYEGEQYYQKFKTIISSYQNKGECVDRLPNAFKTLENEINFSIDKFKTAYNLAELQGSRLRDLIYGNSEDI